MNAPKVSLLVWLLAACAVGAEPPPGFLFGIHTWSTKADPTDHW